MLCVSNVLLQVFHLNGSASVFMILLLLQEAFAVEPIAFATFVFMKLSMQLLVQLIVHRIMQLVAQPATPPETTRNQECIYTTEL